MNDVPIWEKYLLTIDETAQLFNIGQAKVRELANNPRVTFVLTIGTKKLIKKKEFLDYISRQIEV